MTEAIWDKNAIRVKLVKKDGTTRQRSFNNVIQGATPSIWTTHRYVDWRAAKRSLCHDYKPH